MHFNVADHVEAKLVRCVRGSIYDVIVDLRPGSPPSASGSASSSRADNGRALFVPAGFAHGFLTLADDTDVFTTWASFYQPDAARGIRWNDPRCDRLAVEPTVISERDADVSRLRPADPSN